MALSKIGTNQLDSTATPTFAELDVDNVKVNGNTISSTDTNGNVNIDPAGTGDTVMTGSGGQVAEQLVRLALSKVRLARMAGIFNFPHARPAQQVQQNASEWTRRATCMSEKRPLAYLLLAYLCAAMLMWRSLRGTAVNLWS